MAVAWFLMALTHEAGTSAHHVILLWPFPVLFAAVALASLPWRPVAWTAAAVMIAMNLLVLNQYVYQFERDGTGDVWTMTVQEYLESSRWKRFAYRLARNPVILFAIAPLYLFIIRQRFPSAKANKRERHSVYWMNLGILVMALILSSIFGWKAYLLVQLVVLAVAGSAGVWLFYVQHQFEGVYWEHQEEWDYTAAALKGSSFYKLPKVFQWFSGNIGYHHLHHLSSRIPNYNLERCHLAHPLFQTVQPVTLISSLKSISFRLWDEQQRKLVGFSHLKSLRHAKNAMPRC